eukprot:TRINITY_DN2164_c1_g1_i1.p1 TRINITY_DN2164_c1_g1~~TRINITY_DN2164_c1_g1_i1.p1  ORF type:complete len:394 (-),score=54.55 TRINITY_DN2164_c1_g1_i1:61-1242(-)
MAAAAESFDMSRFDGPSGILTPRTERHVRGRRCWLHVWVATFVILYGAALAMTAMKWSDQGLCYRSWWCVTRMYICTFIAALMWVWYLWHSTTREGEVPLGLLVSIWFTTGTISVGCCSFCNWAMVQLWAWMNPYCYITYPADNWPWDYTSGKCMAINVVQWILTAGIIEESFKFVALLRLRPDAGKVAQAANCCRCKLPFIPRAWFLRLADSPLAVALCGVAAGGGLATTENFMYIFSQESIDKAFKEGDLESAYGRIAASFAHMVWTGYAACGLAKWQFLPPGDPARPKSRASYILAPIVLHGLYNWCSTLQRCEAYEETYEGKLYKSDGCYLPPNWRMAFKVGHTIVMLLSFYWWHEEFSFIADDEDQDSEMAGALAASATETGMTQRQS